MIPFEESSGRWEGGGFSRQPDYGFADCQRSVTLPFRHSGRSAAKTRNPAARESAKLSRTPCLNRSPPAPPRVALRAPEDDEGSRPSPG